MPLGHFEMIDVGMFFVYVLPLLFLLVCILFVVVVVVIGGGGFVGVVGINVVDGVVAGVLHLFLQLLLPLLRLLPPLLRLLLRVFLLCHFFNPHQKNLLISFCDRFVVLFICRINSEFNFFQFDASNDDGVSLALTSTTGGPAASVQPLGQTFYLGKAGSNPYLPTFCFPGSVGNYTTLTGITPVIVSLCIPCPPGTYVLVSPAAASTCLPCPIGSFCSGAGNVFPYSNSLKYWSSPATTTVPTSLNFADYIDNDPTLGTLPC